METPSEPKVEKQILNTLQTQSQSQAQAGEKAPDAPQAGSSDQAQAENQAPNASLAGSSSQAQAEDQTPATPKADASGEAQPNLVVASQTARPGGPAISISGVKVGLAPFADSIIRAGSTFSVLTPAPSANPECTVGNELVTANSASQYVFHC